MWKPDSDGMLRTDLKWEIQGAKGTASGILYGLHEGEVPGAKESVKQLARRGDTVNFEEV